MYTVYPCHWVPYELNCGHQAVNLDFDQLITKDIKNWKVKPSGCLHDRAKRPFLRGLHGNHSSWLFAWLDLDILSKGFESLHQNLLLLHQLRNTLAKVWWWQLYLKIIQCKASIVIWAAPPLSLEAQSHRLNILAKRARGREISSATIKKMCRILVGYKVESFSAFRIFALITGILIFLSDKII